MLLIWYVSGQLSWNVTVLLNSSFFVRWFVVWLSGNLNIYTNLPSVKNHTVRLSNCRFDIRRFFHSPFLSTKEKRWISANVWFLPIPSYADETEESSKLLSRVKVNWNNSSLLALSWQLQMFVCRFSKARLANKNDSHKTNALLALLELTLSLCHRT